MNTQLTTQELRQFGLIMAGIIAVLFGLLIPWLFNKIIPLWPWYLSGTFVILALFVPETLGPVYRLWMKFGHIMGWVNTRLILGIVYYTIIMPVGIIMRLFGHDPMLRKYNNSGSYRINSKQRTAKEDLERPF